MQFRIIYIHKISDSIRQTAYIKLGEPIPNFGDMWKVALISRSTELKDINGTEIYEHDVVEINGGTGPIKSDVFFEDGCFCIKMFKNSCELKYYINMDFCRTEVIGVNL